MLGMRILLLLAVALLFAGELAQSQVPPPAPPKATHKPEANSKKHEKNTATDKRGSETSPVFIQIVPPLTLEPQSAKEHEEARDYTSAEWWLVYITGALVLATCGLIIYTARLWGETRNLARDARETSTQQATDMQSSLTIARQYSDAARDANEIAKAAIQLSHRARLIVTFRGDTITVGKKPMVSIGIHNVGMTPAFNVQSETWGGIINYPSEDFGSNSKISENKSNTTIYPGPLQDVVSEITLPNVLTEEQFAQITQSVKIPCFRILINYRDQFGADRHTDYGIGIGSNHRAFSMKEYSTST
jgi:Na+-transporting methylmalonyl-CoA/oxaloacetate decarboxylase gamma subunit